MSELIAVLNLALAGVDGWILAAVALVLWSVGALTHWVWARAAAAGVWLAALALALWSLPPVAALIIATLAGLLAYGVYAYHVPLSRPSTRTRRWPRLARRFIGARVSVLSRTEPGRGFAQLGDRIWPIHCDREVSPGQLVVITGRRGPALTCERADAPGPAAAKRRNDRTRKQLNDG